MKSFRNIILLLIAVLLLIACGKTAPASEPTQQPVSTQQAAVPPSEIAEDELSFETPVTTEAPTLPPTPEPVETPEPTEAPTPEPEGLIGWTEGGFVPREEMSQDAFSYKSDYLNITVTKYVDNKERFSDLAVYFVADIYIRDIECLRTAASNAFSSHSKNQTVKKIAEREHAILAISGDYYGHNNHSLVIRNGETYDLTPRSDFNDLCFLYKDGTMETMTVEDYKSRPMRTDVWQAWQFGPSLLDAEGHAIKEFPGVKINPWNPRCAIGYIEPGHYIFVTVDGRQDHYSRGLCLYELAELMESLGCRIAYNLDGGETAVMYWNGGVFNSPYKGGREISDIVYLIDREN
jgi:exopolysaccharide biosynthesis protein